MNANPKALIYEVDLQPGETLTLPPALLSSLHAGRWIITLEQAEPAALRRHDAFLNGYDHADEGLYDVDASR